MEKLSLIQENNYSNMIVMHSSKDEVLKLVYRVAEWDTPSGLHDPEDRDLPEDIKNRYAVNCKKVVSHHGEYK
jgi:hypothetical protein